MENESKIEKIKKENNKLASRKLESQLEVLLHGQEINREELRVGFRQLADQNRFLFNFRSSLFWVANPIKPNRRSF